VHGGVKYRGEGEEKNSNALINRPRRIKTPIVPCVGERIRGMPRYGDGKGEGTRGVRERIAERGEGQCDVGGKGKRRARAMARHIDWGSERFCLLLRRSVYGMKGGGPRKGVRVGGRGTQM